MREVLAVVALLAAGLLRAQELAWRDSAAAFWSRTEAEFRDPAASPLKPEDRAHFAGLDRFPYDPAFHVTARFTPAVDPPVLTLRTTTARKPAFRPYGTLTFTLAGREHRLTVYQDAGPPTPGMDTPYLFLPFTDLTNGDETYGGGRYLDLKGPLGPTVELDLNLAYNPYCAYNDRYSCPIPPKENFLDLAVRAGVRKFHD